MIRRDTAEAEASNLDAVVIGSGILGASIFRRLVQQGKKVLLVDRADFASGASANSLRILHGGFRYMQSLDLPRFFESVRARRRHARTFPEMVAPLPCLLLLRNEGVRRPSVMTIALGINDLLSVRRNVGVESKACLPNGRILSRREIAAALPSIDLTGVTGGAVWFDLHMTQSVRLVVETIRSGCSGGGLALNFVEATGIAAPRGSSVRLHAKDKVTGRELEFVCKKVFNVTGPLAAATATRLGAERLPDLPLALAWNTLVRKRSLENYAIAVSPHNSADTRNYLLVPRREGLLIGTGQANAYEPVSDPAPSDSQVWSFLDGVNSALPGLNLTPQDIVNTYCGLVPAREPGSSDFARRPWIVDHSKHGGPLGLISAAAVKFTTGTTMADQLIRMAGFREGRTAEAQWQEPLDVRRERTRLAELAQDSSIGLTEELVSSFRKLSAEESVSCVEDLVYRRLGVTDDPQRASEIFARLEPSANSSGQTVSS